MSTIKDYYIKLQDLYNTVINALTAINQSLSTTSSEVSLNIGTEDKPEYMRIPSFLYLDNKVEELQNNFDNLLNLPKSGEAWFTETNNMYKLNMVKGNTAPPIPIVNSVNSIASMTDNTFLRDLVSPKMYLKVKVDNLPSNSEKVYMKKIIFYNENIYKNLESLGITEYNEFTAELYNYKKGVDYDIYSSQIQVPIRKDSYISNFKILEIPTPTDGTTNPSISYTDETNPSIANSKLTYTIKLDTLTYTDSEDTSISIRLKVGNLLTIGEGLNIYKIVNINANENTIILEEEKGHLTLQPYSENNTMVFSLYTQTFNDANYINIPLEENQYICVFLGLMNGQTRSNLSSAQMFNLNNIYMYDENGTQLYTSDGNPYTYITYYNNYCRNIGDMILGFTQESYPQISNYTPDKIVELNSDDIKNAVSSTIDNEKILQVVPINKHLLDDTTKEEILNLHAQKNDLTSQYQSIQNNIDQTYTSLITTDFSQNITITRQSLQAQLDNYYAQKIKIQQQINSIVTQINTKASSVNKAMTNLKYRIRGISNVDSLIKIIQSTTDSKANIIGMQVEYKYKSIQKDTTSNTIINSNTFTDWIIQNNIERNRNIVIDELTNDISFKFVDYNTTDNVIKWNQVDIPIQNGEEVVVRIRYKYNIGQPFVDLYTPYSDELTFTFPTEFIENIDYSQVISQNDSDTITANFTNLLMNDGYTDHVNNKIINGDIVYYHQPDNIYSGFQTPENKLISLKDKLYNMSSVIDGINKEINNLSNDNFKVFLSDESNTIELRSGVLNKLSINNSDVISDTFTKKNLILTIKNTGESPLKLYSIFPGTNNTMLLCTNNEKMNQFVNSYERVVMNINGNIIGQTMGQVIYFRTANPYTKEENIYYNPQQINSDISDNEPTWLTKNPTVYMTSNYVVGLRYRMRSLYTERENLWYFLNWNSKLNTLSQITTTDTISTTSNTNPAFYIYKNINNTYLTRYEDISYTNNNTGEQIYLDSNTNINTFAQNFNNTTFAQTSDYNGGFLIPMLDNNTDLLTEDNGIKTLNAGEQISFNILFEYYLDGNKDKNGLNIKKNFSFDLKNSLFKDPLTYNIDINVDYSNAVSFNTLQNYTSLSDQAELAN